MRTILIIDDDNQLRQALAATLVTHGWQVLSAGEGEQGIALARQHLPKVILCDLLMPGKNGFRVCSAIREDDSLRYSLLVAMSGRDFDDTQQAAMEAGADEFFSKPLDFAKLCAVLDRVVGNPATEPKAATPVATSKPSVKFWGVRGSIPTPGPETVRYGGNTSCVEFRGGGEIIVLDSGTGIRGLGNALSKEFAGKPLALSVLITHSHWDHVQGFPFFAPAYDPANRIRILGFEGARSGLAGIFSAQMESPYFPVGLAQLPSHLSFEELRSMEFSIGGVKVQAAFANHPGVCVGYRLTVPGFSVAYMPDHEPFLRLRHEQGLPAVLKDQALQFAESEDQKIVNFLRDVDVLILDAQFEADEYEAHTGWGHSSVDDAVGIALRANARQLFLFHHDPSHSDAKVDAMVRHAQLLVSERGANLKVDAAVEGFSICPE